MICLINKELEGSENMALRREQRDDNSLSSFRERESSEGETNDVSNSDNSGSLTDIVVSVCVVLCSESEIRNE